MSISALLLVVAVAAQAPSSPSTADLGEAYFLFLEGRSRAADEDLSGAEERYRRVLDLMGDSAEVRVELANLYARQGQVDQAKREAERALALDADSHQGNRILGLLLAAELEDARPDQIAGLAAEAIGYLERAVGNDASDLAANLTLSSLYIRAGRPEPAIERLNEILLDRPGHREATLLLIQAYQAAGRPDEVQQLVDAVRGGGRVSPVETAQRLERLRDWSAAAEAWARVVDEEPDVVRHRLRQAASLANAGRFDDAREVLAEAARLWPDDASSWYLLSQVELRDDRPEAAELAARRITEIDPDDARGVLAVAEVRERQGNFSGVVSALAPRVDAVTPGDVESGAYSRMAGVLSRAYMEIGNAGLAIETLETARGLVPDDLQLLFMLGALYEQTQAFDRAERAFRDLVDADPAHAPGLNYLGYMLAERGSKLDEAASFISRALEIDGDNPSYLDSLGWVYYKQSRFEDALTPLERAASGAPRSSIIQDHLGDVYFQLGRYDEAAAAFDRALEGDRDGVDSLVIQKKRADALDLGGRR